MKAYVGVGSNLGDRRAQLERAAQLIAQLDETESLRASPIYQTAAMTPPGSLPEWNIPYLNAVLEIEWTSTPRDLFLALKHAEAQLGRVPSQKWAPRLIDLDLLLFGQSTINSIDLQVPHPGIADRAFVLRPLRDLCPSLPLDFSPSTPKPTPKPTQNQDAFSRVRALTEHAPLWMGIVNLTPDSFSDGGELTEPEAFARKLDTLDAAGIQILDLGGESTRPGATPVAANEEWGRLQGKLEFVQARYRNQIFRPLISVDTRHASVAAKAVANGANWINDVGAAADPEIIPFLQTSSCDYVLMHSLTVPPSSANVIASIKDPVEEVCRWALDKIDELNDSGISRDRIIFDPGIGFGKTPHQSLEIIERIEELLVLPVRLLVGHSRKSFMNIWGPRAAADRDWESVGVSMRLAEKGVDILRVHEPHLHARAYRAFSESAR